MKLDDALDMTVLSADEEASDNNEASIVLKVVYDNCIRHADRAY